jgi:glycosyltransferase involved in cell wall biosynthesis
MSVPHISVVIPAYNGEAIVGETIEGVLAQTFSDWELLVVDDGSTDGTKELIESYVDDRVRLLTHDGGSNRGACWSRILGTESARGAVIALLDQDDIWDESYLEKHLTFWNSVAPSGVAMSYGPVRFWYPGGAHSEAFSTIPTVGVHAPGSLLAEWDESNFGKAPETPSAVFLRPEIYPQIRRWADLARGSISEDQYLFWYVGARFPIAVHEGAWLRYRKHEASALSRTTMKRTQRNHLDLYNALRTDLAEVLPGHPVTELVVPRRLLELSRSVSWRWKAGRAVRHPIRTSKRMLGYSHIQRKGDTVA